MNGPLARRIIVFVSVGLAALPAAGCWGVKFAQMPQNSLDAAAGVDSLEARVNRLEWRLYRLANELEKQREYSRRVSAERKMDMEELKDDLNAVIQLLSERSGGLAGDASRPGITRERVFPDTLTGDSTLSEAEQSDSLIPPDTTSITVPAPDEMYSQVYLGFARMDYQNALEDSRIFLEEYSGHPLEEKVFFIRGECFMQQKKYFDALKEFSKILKEYPDGEKVPGALLRTAIAYNEIGDRDLAAGVVRRLVRKYPDSEETSTAKQKFGDMLED